MVHEAGRQREGIVSGRVLVVDDQPTMRLLMRTLLERDGYEVIEAVDGIDALERLSTAVVDVVVMDVMMPRLDGITACRRLREGSDPPPVILVTALADRDARVAGKAAGADDFLTKPIDAVELAARVRVLCRTKALSDDLVRERARLTVELNQAQESVARLERLATLGTLASGVGHELKNLAMVIQGVSAEITEGDPIDASQMLERVAQHLDFLGQNLMRLGNLSGGTEEQVDAGEVARQVQQLMIRAGRASGILFQVTVDPTCPRVVSNALELEQVLINLVGNAVDAVEGCPERSVTVIVTPESTGVRLCVTDTGTGMPPDVLARVFEPYFTTKAAGKGTGLGLPVVRQRVSSWGGEIALETKEGAGTTVTLHLLCSVRATPSPP